MKKHLRILFISFVAILMLLISCNDEFKQLKEGSVNEYIYPYIKFEPSADGKTTTAIVVDGAKLNKVKVPATADGLKVNEFIGFENVEDAKSVKEIILGSFEIKISPDAIRQAENLEKIIVDYNSYSDYWGKLPVIEKEGYEFLGWFVGYDRIYQGMPIDPNNPIATPKWRPHDYEYHEGKAPTCTEQGWKPYKTCKNCDYTDYESLPALGHDIQFHERQEATCTENGSIAYFECQRCHLKWTDKECTSLVADVVIKAQGHKLTHYDENSASCNKEGLKERWYCSVCKKFYLDADCTKEASPEDLIIEKLEHVYGSEWVNDDPSGHYHICKLCGQHSETSPHEWDEGIIQKEPNPEENGEKLFTCTVCGFTRTEEIVDGEHDWGAPVIIPPKCTEEGYTIYTCSICGKTWKTDYVDPTGHKTVFVPEVPATCQNTGNKAHWHCTNSCGLDYEDKNASQIIEDLTLPIVDHVWTIVYDKNNPDKGHWHHCEVGGESLDPVEHVYNVRDESHLKANATCLKPAIYWLSCECGYCPEDDNYVYEIGGLADHKLEHHDKKQATCTEDGNIEYWYCNVCKKYFADSSAQKKISEDEVFIERYGHDWATVYDSDNDYHWLKCLRCNAIKDKQLHDAKTLNTDADYHWWSCSVCGKNIIDKKKHTFEIKDGCKICTVCKYVAERNLGDGSFDVSTEDLAPHGSLSASSFENDWTILFVPDKNSEPVTKIEWYVNEVKQSVNTKFFKISVTRPVNSVVMCVYSNDYGVGSVSYTVPGKK